MLVGRSMGPAIVRSSLEVMLDALRQKEDKSKDSIPALPVRPVSRGRLPSSRRPLQANFNIENNEIGTISKKEVFSQEETGDQNIQVICIQKHVRGVKARRNFQELKKGVIPLQSFIRGCLARKHFDNIRSLNISEKNSARLLMDKYQEQLREAHEAVQELQNQVLKAEVALKDKDEENNTLKQQIQRYESKWLEYDMKMKSMEETWQQRMASLQMSLAEAKKCIAANENLQNQQTSHNTPTNNRYCDSEDTSQEFQTPDTTPAKQTRTYAALLLVNSNNNGPQSAVNGMVKEFENKTKEFEDEARTLVEVKPGNSDEEIHNLKLRFKKWKKDYKIKLREMKAELHKHVSSDSLRIRRKWWSLRSTK